MRFTKEEIAYGILMGDGYLSPLPNKNRNSRLEHIQCIQHKEYSEWLHTIVSKLWKTKQFKRTVGCGFNDKRFEQVGFRTTVYPYFTHLRRNVFYKSGKKKIDQRILSKLTPLSLAIWYMDDGSFRFSRSDRKNGKKGDRKILLYTGGFTLKEQNLIQNYFERKWDISWHIFKLRNQFALYCGVKEGLKFIQLIKPFIPPSMYYKIDLKYQMLSKSPLSAEILKVYPEYKLECKI